MRNIPSVIEHTQGSDLDAHLKNMREMLERGQAHFLIGGIITDSGVQPVTFVKDIPNDAAHIITEMTPNVVSALLETAISLRHTH